MAPTRADSEVMSASTAHRLLLYVTFLVTILAVIAGGNAIYDGKDDDKVLRKDLQNAEIAFRAAQVDLKKNQVEDAKVQRENCMRIEQLKTDARTTLILTIKTIPTLTAYRTDPRSAETAIGNVEKALRLFKEEECPSAE